MIYKQDDKSYLDEVVALVQEYITELHRDLTFQNLQQELNDLSSQYLPPYGHLMIAVKDHQVIGCVALHKHSDMISPCRLAIRDNSSSLSFFCSCCNFIKIASLDNCHYNCWYKD